MRTIGIRHRIKQTAEDEARPTMVVILDGEQEFEYQLADEQAELDFLRGVYPTAFRAITRGDALDTVPNHHLILKKVKKGVVVPEGTPTRVIDRQLHTIEMIAGAFEGLRPSDRVAMVLGGSGDYFALALARRGMEIGADVYRIPAVELKHLRGGSPKDDDAPLLGRALIEHMSRFYKIRTRDAELITIREAQRARIDAMKARIGCEQRLRQRFIGTIFCRPDGYFPEGAIEKLYDEEEANDAVYTALLKEEAKRERELQRLVESSGVWKHVLADVDGVGWAIAARIISAVVDIRRFPSKEKFKAFSGVHLLEGGRFARRRGSELANWNPDVRQALYLLGDQMNKRPETYWGEKLRANKLRFRSVHPEPVLVDGKKRYTDGHTHKMATWRTLTQFAMWLYREWDRFERDPQSFRVRHTYEPATHEHRAAA